MRKALTFDDVSLVPAYCGFESRENVSTKVDLGKGYVFNTPLIPANMDTIAGAEMVSAIIKLGGLGILHRFMSIEENIKEFERTANLLMTGAIVCPRHLIGVSLGVNEGLDRAKALFKAGARIMCVDLAHAHSKLAAKMIKALRAEFGEDVLIIGGNVATYAGSDSLVGWGVDVVKVGVGAGGVCVTRTKTGFGIPQLTAIMDCSRCSKPIIADGGIRVAGDFVKSLAAGATMAMAGGIFAGCDETPGEVGGAATIIQRDGSKTIVEPHKFYRGMASKEAYEDFKGPMPEWKTAEGVSRKVPCRGPMSDVVKDFMGGLRSGLTYCGAANIKELQSRAEFIEITPSGAIEGTPHFKGL